jgi:hypothetical protein
VAALGFLTCREDLSGTLGQRGRLREFLGGPGDLDAEADDDAHAGTVRELQGDDAAEGMAEQDRSARVDEVSDRVGHVRERILEQPSRAAVAGQIRRDPGCRARPVGQAAPHVGGRAESVQQQDRR